tara:strand:+ start:767 stop:1285 length:519 start_codon:yes stop_codon:yes gene_type:complete
MVENFIEYRFCDDESRISSSDFSKIFEIIANTDKFSEGQLRDWLFNPQDVIITSQRVILNSANRFGLEWDQWDNKPKHFYIPKEWEKKVPVINDPKFENPLSIFYITDHNRIFVFKPPGFNWSLNGEKPDRPGFGNIVHGFFDIAQILFDGVIDVAFWEKTKELTVEFSSLR